jgi:predicted dehydrogenase
MPDKKARIGFIGTGWWATANHLPLLKQRAEELGKGTERI